MTLKSLLVSLLAGMMCASCGPTDSSAGDARGNKTLAGAADTSKGSRQGEVRIPVAPADRSSPDSVAGGAAPNAAAQTGGSADLSDIPLAPKDARWTIYCATVADESHVETSRGLKAALIKRTDLHEWYIMHEATRSRLYYGFYRSIDDPADAKESARAQADRKKIDQLVDGGGERPFRACQFVQLSAPDPESPPEWNLVNAPPDRMWTLEIGAYKDHPDRKKAAVEAVRAAREAGEEAYYYHGDTVSSVCIGAWPEAAVVEERTDPDPQARKNGRGDIMVLPPGVKAGRVRDKNGRPVSAVSVQLVAVDEGLKNKIEQYPNMGVNGQFITYNVRGKTWLQGTLIKPIPRPSDTLFRDNVAQEQANDGRGLDSQDPFSRPGYQDTAADPGKSPPVPAKRGGSGKLPSLDKR